MSTADDRRALLYSYQPAGHPHLRELLKLAPRDGASLADRKFRLPAAPAITRRPLPLRPTSIG